MVNKPRLENGCLRICVRIFEKYEIHRGVCNRPIAMLIWSDLQQGTHSVLALREQALPSSLSHEDVASKMLSICPSGARMAATCQATAKSMG